MTPHEYEILFGVQPAPGEPGIEWPSSAQNAPPPVTPFRVGRDTEQPAATPPPPPSTPRPRRKWRWSNFLRKYLLIAVALVALLFVANQTNDDSESSLAASPAKTQGDRLDGIVFGTVTNPPQSTTSTTPAAENQTGLNIEARAVSVEAVAAAREQLDDVRVVSEFTGFTDYVRDDYTGGGWPDSDGDCQSDRHEILIEESLVEPTLDADGCRVLSGLWIDAYDGTTYTEADQVTIDHFVPLAAAHRAGGWEWDLSLIHI